MPVRDRRTFATCGSLPTGAVRRAPRFEPIHVAAYVERLGTRFAKPSVKQHPGAIAVKARPLQTSPWGSEAVSEPGGAARASDPDSRSAVTGVRQLDDGRACGGEACGAAGDLCPTSHACSLRTGSATTLSS